MLKDPVVHREKQSKRVIKVGSRKSQLALTQTKQVISQLSSLYPEYEYSVEVLDTIGDRLLEVAPAEIGEKGIFTQELEAKLLDRTLDFVVHSLKDLPTNLPRQLILAAVTKRENPADALIIHPKHKACQIDTLPDGSVVGTSSLRRIAQLKYRFPQLETKSLRGNVITRLEKLKNGQYDAIVLASAGLVRLKMAHHIHQIFSPRLMMHAVGQGALGIECHKDNTEVRQMLRRVDDFSTHQSCSAERALLRSLEGGCQAPIGVDVSVKGDDIDFRAIVVDLEGRSAVEDRISGSVQEPEEVGCQLAKKLLNNGAGNILRP